MEKSASAEELSASALRTECNAEQFEFQTTETIVQRTTAIGQARATSALELAIGVDQPGYNAYVLGREGVGKRHLVDEVLDRAASSRPPGRDYCYVYNFDDPQRPRLLTLPPGKGNELKRAMRHLVDDLQNALKSAFESEEYRSRRQAIDEEFNEKPQQGFTDLQKHAHEKGLAVLRSPAGIMVAPTHDDEVLTNEEFQKLPEEERTRLESEIKAIEAEFKAIIQGLPELERDRREKLHELNSEITILAVSLPLGRLRSQFARIEGVDAFINAVEADVIENAIDLVQSGERGQDAVATSVTEMSSTPPGLRRYDINVLVDHGGETAAPVVYEDSPTFQDLLGSVEHASYMGNLLTDFRLVKGGSLHRANGGYLIVDVRKLLMQPFAYEGLKRALTRGELRIESPGKSLSLFSTITLDPEPIPLDVKVILLGDRELYYRILEIDPDFEKLFKVQADFADEIDRCEGHCQELAGVIADVARRDQLAPFTRDAVARLIDEQARASGEADKLSTQMEKLVDLMREAHYFAKGKSSATVDRAHIDEALDARIFRASRIRDRMFEAIDRDIVLIETEGSRIGQINALSAMELGDFVFGRPGRITARVSLGKGGVVDIEREVELGGPIHSKGVMILSGFVAGRYGTDYPHTLSATLVFEQSYGGIEGDSASCAELLALLSAISDVPLRQSIAITGSVNQHGDVQAIGAVNEKIEGFFEICRRRGLEGKHGVIIPRSNARHLMLRKEVVEAVDKGSFHIYAVSTVDQAIELMTGLPAGQRGETGVFPPSSINGIVEARLREFAETVATFGKGEEE